MKKTEGFYQRPVCRSEAVLLVSKNHPLAGEKEVPFASLKGDKFVTISPEYMFYDVMMEKCREGGVEPEFPWTLSLIYKKDKFITVPMQCFLDICFEAR